jgi:hypothetical protein
VTAADIDASRRDAEEGPQAASGVGVQQASDGQRHRLLLEAQGGLPAGERGSWGDLSCGRRGAPPDHVQAVP